MKLFSYFILVFIFISCGNNGKRDPSGLQEENVSGFENLSEKSDDSDTENPVKDTIPEEEILNFFKEYQMLFRKDKLDKICDRVIYPMQGDCIYYFCFGDSIFTDNFSSKDHPINREVFRKNFNEIFAKEVIQLIKKADVNQLISNNEYECTVGDLSKTYHTIGFSKYESENEEILVLSINYIDRIESINEHGITYRFKKIGEEIKLYLINCMG